MVQTRIKAPESISFWQACRNAGVDGADISDWEWDWGVYLDCPEEDDIDKLDDECEKFCLLLCLNLKCKGLTDGWYTPVNACEFIEENRAAFDRFMNEENREGFRPMDFPKPLKADEDEGYYEVYMGTLENLIVGNYAFEDYEKLIRYLTEEGDGK